MVKSSWGGAVSFSLPVMIVYAFISLSAWCLCRAFPLPGTSITKMLFSLMCAAFLSSVFWLLVCYLWASELEWIEPGSFQRHFVACQPFRI
jgi:hypothetical protein